MLNYQSLLGRLEDWFGSAKFDSVTILRFVKYCEMTEGLGYFWRLAINRAITSAPDIKDMEEIDITRTSERAITNGIIKGIMPDPVCLGPVDEPIPMLTGGDMEVKCEGDVITVWKCMLARLPHFTNGINMPKESFMRLYEYVCTDAIRSLTPTIALDISLADSVWQIDWAMPGLMRMCLAQQTCHTTEEYFEMLKKAVESKQFKIRRQCLDFIMKNWKELLRTESYENLPADTKVVILTEILLLASK